LSKKEKEEGASLIKLEVSTLRKDEKKTGQK
jgi:hypothetical protein